LESLRKRATVCTFALAGEGFENYRVPVLPGGGTRAGAFSRTIIQENDTFGYSEKTGNNLCFEN